MKAIGPLAASLLLGPIITLTACLIGNILDAAFMDYPIRGNLAPWVKVFSATVGLLSAVGLFWWFYKDNE